MLLLLFSFVCCGDGDGGGIVFIFICCRLKLENVVVVLIFRGYFVEIWLFLLHIFFFSFKICFHTNQHSLNICWMNGNKKKVIWLNQWVGRVCVCLKESNQMVFIPMSCCIFYFSFCHITSCHGFCCCWQCFLSPCRDFWNPMRLIYLIVYVTVKSTSRPFFSHSFSSFCHLPSYVHIFICVCPWCCFGQKCHFKWLNKYTSERKNTHLKYTIR